MKVNIRWFLFGMVICFIALLIFNKCEDKKPIKYIKGNSIKGDSVFIVKTKIVTEMKEVIKWKEAKDKIKYRTTFDSTDSIKNVLVNLKKCDTIVKIDSIIIYKQDTIIVQKDAIIFQQDELVDDLYKKVKKEKRKLLFTKIIAGVIIVFTIVASL